MSPATATFSLEDRSHDTSTQPAPSQGDIAELTELIATLIQSVNTKNTTTFAALFAPEATIHDGGLHYTAPDAATRWLRESHQRYALRLQLLSISGQHTQWTLEALVTGTFEGSPVRLDHYLTICQNKITHLEI